MQSRMPFKRLKQKMVKRWNSSPFPSSVKQSEQINLKAGWMCWMKE